MDNLEWLNSVKKADGDVKGLDKAMKKAESELDGEIFASVIIDFRKIKALEIIAEEFCKFNNKTKNW